MAVNQEKMRCISHFFLFDKGVIISCVVEIMVGFYGLNTVTANYLQLWFFRFHYGIFDLKDALPQAKLDVGLVCATPINKKSLSKRNEIDPFLERMVTSD